MSISLQLQIYISYLESYACLCAYHFPYDQSLAEEVTPRSCHIMDAADGVQALSSQLQQHSHAVASQLPALVASPAQLLQQAAAQDIQTVASGDDTAASDVCHVLLGLHVAFTATDCSDGVLRAATALRLGLLLEEQGQRGQALKVAEQVCPCIDDLITIAS